MLYSDVPNEGAGYCHEDTCYIVTHLTRVQDIVTKIHFIPDLYSDVPNESAGYFFWKCCLFHAQGSHYILYNIHVNKVSVGITC